MQVGAVDPAGSGSPRSPRRRRCRSRRARGRAARPPRSRIVRPAWFSKPASVSPAQAQSSSTSPIIRRSPATVWSGRRPMPGSSAPAPVAVVAAEELVAAADGEERPLRPRRRACSAVALRGEVRRDELLLAVLAAADVEEVDPGGNRVAEPDRRHLELVAAGGGAGGEDGDVAAVGVDVQVARGRGGRRGSSCRLLPEVGDEAAAARRSRAAPASPCRSGGRRARSPAGVSSRPRSSAGLEVGDDLDPVAGRAPP